MTTITVDDSYLLKAGKTLSFSNETGFELIGTGSPSLTIAGTLNVTANSSVSVVEAISADVGVGTALLWNQKSGVVSVSATGTTTAAVAASFHCAAEVTNDGLIHAEAQYASQAFYFQALSGIERSHLTNSGQITVSAQNNQALAIGGLVDVVNIGSIEADSAFAAALVSTSGGSLDNSGSIDASGSMQIRTVRMNGDLHNSGEITATATVTTAVALEFVADGFVFDNGGSIKALDTGESQATGVVISASSSAAEQVIDNSGLIQARFAFTSAASSTSIILDNTGQILGDVRFNEMADELHNSGKIVGAVYLDAGDDSYLTEGKGKLTGAVFGGDGNDLIIGGKTGETLSGDGPFGSGDDSLTGGGGADSLSGGAGSDRFVYLKLADSAGAKADLITDLGDEDIIDLSKIDANSTRDGNQAFHLVAALDGHAGQVALTYDAANDVTRLKLDVDGDAKADATILISGDLHGFTNFVL
jgi:hypothetical protein